MSVRPPRLAAGLLSAALLAGCFDEQTALCGEGLDVNDLGVNFVVLSRANTAPGGSIGVVDPADPERTLTADEVFREQLALVADTLVTEAGEQPCAADECVGFRHAAQALPEDYAGTRCDELIALGDSTDPAWPDAASFADELTARIAACDDPRLRRPFSVQLYVFDAWTPDQGYDAVSAFGRPLEVRGEPLPFAAIDVAQVLDASALRSIFGELLGLEPSSAPLSPAEAAAAAASTRAIQDTWCRNSIGD